MFLSAKLFNEFRFITNNFAPVITASNLAVYPCQSGWRICSGGMVVVEGGAKNRRKNLAYQTREQCLSADHCTIDSQKVCRICIYYYVRYISRWGHMGFMHGVQVSTNDLIRVTVWLGWPGDGGRAIGLNSNTRASDGARYVGDLKSDTSGVQVTIAVSGQEILQ